MGKVKDRAEAYLKLKGYIDESTISKIADIMCEFNSNEAFLEVEELKKKVHDFSQLQINMLKSQRTVQQAILDRNYGKMSMISSECKIIIEELSRQIYYLEERTNTV